MLPSVSPTVDWVRLPQRFPVRIQVDSSVPAELRIGQTASVAISHDVRVENTKIPEYAGGYGNDRRTRQSSRYEDTTHEWIRCDPRTRFWHADSRPHRHQKGDHGRAGNRISSTRLRRTVR